MKTIFTLLFACILTAAGYSQVTNEGAPASWKVLNAEPLAAITMPGFDLAKLQKEDMANDHKKDRPFRFGYEFFVDYDTENSGLWTTLPNGDKIWRIRFYSSGAKSMNFIFDDFYMPEGATLYLYNNEKTDVLGAYTSSQNTDERMLGTWLVQGQDIWIEYYEPKEVSGRGSLHIERLIHGYRGADDMAKSTADLNESGICNYDVNCTMGNIDALKDINKKSVALIVLGGGFCSGALINNTANDGTPYFLTANHCYEGGPSPATWSFRFNWISQNPVCAQNQNSTNFNGYHTVSGASLRARREESDFCLLRLSGNLNPNWDLTWAGWSRSTTAPPYTFGIHHPSGDIMKVCKDNNPPVSSNDFGINVWVIQNWDQGVTEGGSSGSPLFDNNGRIIGQLFGGDAECNGTTDNGGSDEYGRFNVSWNTGSNSSSRLRDWLDPINTNAGILDPIQWDDIASVDDVAVPAVTVYPNPSNGIFTIAGVTSAISYEVYNILGQQVKRGEIDPSANTVNLNGEANGIYILKINDASSGKTSGFKLVKE